MKVSSKAILKLKLKEMLRSGTFDLSKKSDKKESKKNDQKKEPAKQEKENQKFEKQNKDKKGDAS